MAWWNTGEGTPWGPMESGKPNTPNLITDINQVPGMDQSGQRRAIQRRIATGAGNAAAATNASLQKAGIGGSGSADAARAAERIGDAQAQSLADAEANLQAQDFNQRAGLMDLLNRTALQRYGIDAGNYNAEQAARGNFWNGIAQAGGNLATLGLMPGGFMRG